MIDHTSIFSSRHHVYVLGDTGGTGGTGGTGSTGGTGATGGTGPTGMCIFLMNIEIHQLRI